MSADNANNEYGTKIKSLITSYQSSDPSTDLKDGLAGSDVPSYARMDGMSSVSPVISLKPELKTNIGVKHDSAKPPVAYIPIAGIMAEAEAFGFGAKKYDAWNYKNGLAVVRTLSAAVRHIYQFLSGEDKDVESGVHHLGCARANIAMALDTLANHPELDDRFKGGK